MRVYKPKSTNDIMDIIWSTADNQGISDYKLAKISGISQQTITRMRADERIPHNYQIFALLQAANLEMRIIEKGDQKK